MRTLYDTRTVHPLERYDYYRAGAGTEVAPVAIHGRAPGHLLAAMSVVQIGDLEFETFTWAADSELVAQRTDRLIRACDPECYRILLSVNGGARMEQQGNQVHFRARDIALYDLSYPWKTAHSTGLRSMRVVMLTFPRALLPIGRATVRQLLKRLRLEECRRALQDPMLTATPIKEVVSDYGYLRHDQFARDFKQLFGVSAKQVRQLCA